MGKKNNLIPFEWLPASWGLKGRPFDEAKANYELEGEDLERRLIDINFTGIENKHEHMKLAKRMGRIDDYAYEIAEATLLNDDVLDPKDKVRIDFSFKKIDGYERDLKLAEIAYPDFDSLDRQLAILQADHEHGKIETLEYEKTAATAKGEPWVGIVDNGFDSDQGVNGLYFELDWNEKWVEFLKKNGYHGTTDEQIVEQWFSDVCRSQADESPVDDNQPVPFNSGRVINRIPRDNGGTEYS
jgi:hypothetical protein